MVLALAGGCSSPGTLVTSDMTISQGKTIFVWKQPKDMAFAVADINPTNGTVHIEKYQSSANAAALQAGTAQFEFLSKLMDTLKPMAEAYIKSQTGGIAP